MPIIPKRNESNMTGFGTLPQAIDVNMPNPLISGVQPTGGQDYLVKPLENLSNLFIKAQEEADKSVALKFDNDLTQKKIEIIGKFGQQQGENAFNYQPYQDEFRKYADEKKKGVSQRVLNKILPVIDSHGVSLYSALQGHSNNEIAKWKDEQETSSIDLSYKSALANSDNPSDIADAMAKALAVTADRGIRYGWAKEKTDLENQKMFDAFYGGIIEKRLAENKDISAQNFYNDNKEWISGEKRLLLEAKLKIGTTEGGGRRIVNQVMNEFPDFDKSFDAEKRIVELGNGNENVIKNAIGKYRDLYNSYHLQKSTQSKMNTDRISGKIANGEIKTVEELTSDPIFPLLDGGAQEQFRNHVSSLSMANQNKEIAETAITEAFNIYNDNPDNIAKQNEKLNSFISNPSLFKAIKIELNGYRNDKRVFDNDKKVLDTNKQENFYNEAEKILKENGEKYGFSKDLYMLVPEQYTLHLTSANLNRLKQAQYIFNYKERDNQANTLESYLDGEKFKDLLTGKVSINRLMASKSLSPEGKNILAALYKEYDPKKLSSLQSALKIVNPKTLYEYKPDATETERSVTGEKFRNQIIDETLQAIQNGDVNFNPIERAEELLKPVKEGFWSRIIGKAVNPNKEAYGQAFEIEERIKKDKTSQNNSNSSTPYRIGLQIEGINKITGQKEVRKYVGNGQWKLIKTL